MRTEDWMKQALLEELTAEIEVLEASLSADERREMQDQAVRFRPAAEKYLCKELREMKKNRWKYPFGQIGKMAAVAVLVLTLGLGGVCLASPEIRENLFTLVENTVGGYTQLHVQHNGTPETAESPVTVDADDPRLRYVHPDWCLHYYPLEIPRYYSSVETSYVESPTDTLMTRVDEAGNEWVEPSGFYYLTDDFREMWLERDRQMITFRTVDGDGYYEFIEDGTANSRYDVDTKLDEMNIEIIDGKEVYVIERSGGDTTFVWQEGDHMLTLTSNDFRYQMEYVFSTIERIR